MLYLETISVSMRNEHVTIGNGAHTRTPYTPESGKSKRDELFFCAPHSARSFVPFNTVIYCCCLGNACKH